MRLDQPSEEQLTRPVGACVAPAFLGALGFRSAYRDRLTKGDARAVILGQMWCTEARLRLRSVKWWKLVVVDK